MGLFDQMLKEDESLFQNEVALDFSYQPKVILHRENEQKEIAYSIRPLLSKRNGRNLFIYGKPGIGKTVATKHVLRVIEEGEEDLGDDYEDIYTIYINCWQKNTSYKIIVEICDQIGYKFTQNKKSDELMKVAANIINRQGAVFVFDEVDKLEEYDFLYTLVEQIYRKAILMVTNHKEWIVGLDERVKSRLSADLLEFEPYNAKETKDILEQRKEWAFREGVFEEEAFSVAVQKAIEAQDIRVGLHVLKEAGSIAEAQSSKSINSEHIQKAVSKLDQLSVKNPDELNEDEKFILKIIKNNNYKKIGDLYKAYQEEKGEASYKTFQRKIKKLADNKFVSVKKVQGGPEGSTTIVSYLRTKKLTDY
ncbi:MAG: Cdc6/Cdc18 family protein [Candidatus Nanoarchaeia archaeon]